MLMRWLSQHTQSALDGLKQVRRAPLTALVTAAVIGVTLTFPTTIKVILDNAATVSEHLKQSIGLTVYLKQTANRHEAVRVANTLRKRSDILTVQTISPSAGLQQLADAASIESDTRTLSDNPLPWVIIVTPRATSTPTDTLTRLNTLIATFAAVDTIQMDTQWTTRLEAILKTTHRVMLALTALLGLAVLLITGNTIWAVIRRHSHEIQIIRLTGGTARFIRRPFLYAGAFYGFLGAVLAWILVNLLINAFEEPIRHLAALYNTSFTLAFLSPADTAKLLTSGIVLGLLGAWLAVTRYLHSLETR